MAKNTIIKVALPLPDMLIFQKLIKELKYKNRFFLSEECEKFCNNLIKYSKLFKTHNFDDGMSFYRARINDFDDAHNQSNYFSLEQMGAPPAKHAKNGRLNPQGISCLYLADDINTSIAEVRPWVECKITVAEFVLRKDINVINLSDKVFLKDLRKIDSEKYEGAEFTWKQLISWMFSVPFDPRDDTAYVPTQFIAERIKKEGFDGILYDSALSPGYNLVLFDETNVEGVKLFYSTVRNISYENEVQKAVDLLVG